MSLCCSAFEAVRAYDCMLDMAIVVALMADAGIADVPGKDAFDYVRKSCMVSKSTDEASSRFQKLIAQSLRTLGTQVNNLMHNIAQEIA